MFDKREIRSANDESFRGSNGARFSACKWISRIEHGGGGAGGGGARRMVEDRVIEVRGLVSRKGREDRFSRYDKGGRKKRHRESSRRAS